MRGDRTNRRRGHRRRQCALLDRGAHRRLDQFPRCRDLAADVHRGRIEGIDDGGQADAEIATGRLQRRSRFEIGAARADEQIVNRERLARRRSRLGVLVRNSGSTSRGSRHTLPSIRRAARATRPID